MTPEHAARRPDIQGLRALAVTLVVVYHLYPSALPGGYVGVDVFFVISGFLITGLLARTVRRTGRVGLLDFYARRARRLLPAATLVLAVTWLGSRLVLPATQLPEAARQIRASALYFQNWTLAGDAVDYLKSDEAASPVQHYWSLSVEEQFYLVWPLVFLVAAAVAWAVSRRRAVNPSGTGARGAGSTVALVLAIAVVGMSLWFSVHETASDPAAAYFVTTTRIWELALGGVLALLPAMITDRLARCGPLAWVGLAAVVASAVLMSASTAFPGTAALVPVLGAVLLIACGGPSARFGPARLTSARPAVFVGGLSYSLYLWHWPVIVLVTAYLGRGVGPVSGPLIAAASVGLAWATKRWVEDPVRTARLLTTSRLRSLATATAALVPVTLVSIWIAGQPATSAAPDAAHPGAAVLAGNTTVASTTLIPALSQAASDIPTGITPKCESSMASAAVTTCALGDTTDPDLTIALVGDSHAGQWSDALERLAEQKHWELIVAIKSECPMTATETALVGQSVPYSSCTTWGRSLMTQLLTTIKPDVVIASDRAYNAVLPDTKADATSLTAVGQGMATYWKQLMAQGIEVVAIDETPEAGQNVPDCLAAKGGTIASCSRSAADAITTTSPVQVAAAATGGAVPVIDMNTLICPGTVCLPAVGNVIVYLDSHHLNHTYTMTLEPYLAAKLLRTPAFTAAAAGSV